MNTLNKIVSWVFGLTAFLLCYAGYYSDNLILYVSGICIVGVMLILSWMKDRQSRKMNAQKPPVTVEATVVSHRIIQEKAGSRYVTRYYISFRPADGSPNLEFEVSQLDFEDFDVGEAGPLRYRGWEFLSFGVKDKSGFKPMAPLAEEYEAKPEPKSALQRAGDRIYSLWMQLKAKPVHQEKMARDRADGILTHELDEK